MSNLAHDALWHPTKEKAAQKRAAQEKMLNSAIGLVLVAIHAALLRLAILIELTRLLATLLMVAIELAGLLPTLLLLVTIGVARMAALVLVTFVVHCVPHDIIEPSARARIKRKKAMKVPESTGPRSRRRPR
jgi:hypothetical protein